MSRDFYILRSDPNDLAFYEVFQDALDLIATTIGVHFRYTALEEGGEGMGRLIYKDDSGKAAISVVEDHQTPVRFLVVEAEEDELGSQVGSLLATNLPFISLRELQEEARGNMTNDPGSLVRLAAGAGLETEPVSFDILMSGMRHRDARVRCFAAKAAGVTLWPDFFSPLQDMLATDPDPMVKEAAAIALNRES